MNLEGVPFLGHILKAGRVQRRWRPTPSKTEDEMSDPDIDDPPAVLSPGDNDAPDAPEPDTVYPDEQGAPGQE